MKPIYVTNTLSKQKEEFVPLNPLIVSMYHCGPTVYWNQHIGNMRAVVMGDIIRRTFEYNGYTVNHVRNYTDVGHLSGDNFGDADTGEDRMEKAAKREAVTPDEIANKYIATYEADIKKLNTLFPTSTPRATHYITHMQNMISKLLQNDFAYITPTAVFFDISKFPNYAQLSRQDMSKLVLGTGHGEVNDSTKKNPGDFALWFFKTGVHDRALQTWPSPFESNLVTNGEGFPGWHIECSSFIESLLGDTIDIHIGGIEHIPIHHTNEIAQSTCAHEGAPLAHYWLHNEHLQVDSKKMSKSEGTSYVIADIEEKGFNPLVLRYFFLQAHYRSQQNFTWAALTASQTAFNRLVSFFVKLPNTGGAIITKYQDEFNKNINDDFDTAAALAVVWDLIKDQNEKPQDIYATLLNFDTVLGLNLINQTKQEIIITSELEDLLNKRAEARSRKDYKLSDELRDTIKTSFGYDVKDSSEGQQLEKI